jgi:hypothetical protein
MEFTWQLPFYATEYFSVANHDFSYIQPTSHSPGKISENHLQSSIALLPPCNGTM